MKTKTVVLCETVYVVCHVQGDTRQGYLTQIEIGTIQSHNRLKNKYYHTVETVPKSRKTNTTTLSKQFQNLEKQILPHCWNSSKI